MSKKIINLFDSLEDHQNENIKYSQLLDTFTGPFQNDFPEDYYLEDIFEFALLAWNFGNIRAKAPKEEFEKIMATSPDKNLDFDLLKKMIEHKVSYYKQYNRFISDLDITGDDSTPILTVTTESEQSYFENMADNFPPESLLAEDYEEGYIDRYALVLKPKQPFLDWLNALYPDDEQPQTMEASVYLVDDGIDDLDKWLRKKYDKFFCMELNDWHTRKNDWPRKRNFKMFGQWFQVDISTVVYDIEKRPVIKEG